jgi:outer membrane protein TolC
MNEIGLTEKNIESVSLKGSLEDYRQLLDYSIDSENLNELIENSSSIRTIKNQLESAELSRKEAMASYYFPSVNLSLSASPYSYNYSLASQSGSSGSNTFTASVGFSISLDNYIPGSAASDSIADIDDTIKTYELQIEEKRSELKTSIVEKINSIEIAQDSLSNCENNVKLAKKTYELALTAYQNGTKDLTSLQTILASYNDAVLQLNSQQLTLIKGILELKNTLGI